MESEALSLPHPVDPWATVHQNEEISHRSVLHALKSAIGDVPSVLLRDTNTGLETPVVRPSSPEMPADKGRYQLLGEIGHGGMGAVFKGRDPDLGRDLAVKVLLEQFHDDPEMTRRFVEEAQIGGQLQHPGIAPVYELGSFADGRPYFTMKLVKGRTLAALLKERTNHAHELPRFLGIFEQVCQTMAYAHARGVIHRDLKPSNVMVGAFGEVQVMDWGLAKVLPQGGTADESPPHPDQAAVSVIRTVRAGSEADASRAGSVLGTPPYMAPEQARGDVESVDERSDVFGLGSILCELLTGQPAYTGPSSNAILRKAIRGETADALRRLEGCGADAELISLAKDCLAVEPEERPRDAGEIVRTLTAYLAGVQERLRAAELARAAEAARAEEAQATAAAAERARAAEEARAEEARAAATAADGRARAERRALRMTVGLAASVLIAGTLGAAGWTWVERDRFARIATRSGQVNAALQEATGLWGQAQAAPIGDLVPWTKALAAAQKARVLLEPGLDRALRGEVEALLAATTSEKEKADAAARAARSDRLLLDKLVDIRSAKTDDPNGSIGDRDYAEAFREAGIDVTALPPAEAGALIKARPATVAAALVSALDDWAERRSRRLDRLGALRLFAAANAADPDPWRVSLRRALDLADRAARARALRDLAASTKPETAPAVDLDLLGKALYAMGEPKTAEEVLRAGRRRFPDDVWLNFDLGLFLKLQSRGEEAVRYYSIARALRPETAHDLAHVLTGKGESVEAIAVFRDLVRLRPDDGRHWACYSTLLKETGDSSGSREAFEKAAVTLRRRIQLKPDDVLAHYNLGNVLGEQGKPDEAIAAYREAIRIKPGYAYAHIGLGNALCDQRKLDEAIAAYGEAIRLKPDDAEAHLGFGYALNKQGKLDEAIGEYRSAVRLKPDYASAHYNLGFALSDQGKSDEAIAAFREAIRLKPDHAFAHNGLGNALKDKGRLDEAIAAYREAIRIKPESEAPHHKLGIALRDQGKVAEAITEYRAAIRLNRDEGGLHVDHEAGLHVNLGAILCDDKHDYDGAIVEFREAIRLKPDDAMAHNNLGVALKGQGKIEQAIGEYREAIRLEPGLALAHRNLGNTLLDQGKTDEAIAEYKEAIRLKPDYANPHNGLGNALKDQGKLDEAIAAYREAIRLKPDYANAHNGLGNALRDLGKLDEAIAEYREAIRLKPDSAIAHSNLGNALRD